MSGTDRYWEIYDDQDAEDFDLLEYNNLQGNTVQEDIVGNLAQQVAGIRRRNGRSTEIKVYKKEVALV